MRNPNFIHSVKEFVNENESSLDPYGNANSLVLWTKTNSLESLVFDGHIISKPRILKLKLSFPNTTVSMFAFSPPFNPAAKELIKA